MAQSKFLAEVYGNDAQNNVNSNPDKYASLYEQLKQKYQPKSGILPNQNRKSKFLAEVFGDEEEQPIQEPITRPSLVKPKTITPPATPTLTPQQQNIKNMLDTSLVVGIGKGKQLGEQAGRTLVEGAKRDDAMRLAEMETALGRDAYRDLPDYAKKYGYMQGQSMFADWERKYPDAANKLATLEIKRNRDRVFSPNESKAIGLIDTASMGAFSRMTDEELRSRGLDTSYNPVNISKEQNPVNTTAGQMAGYLIPGTAIERGVGVVAKPLLNKLPSKILQRGITGAVAGGTQEATEGIIRGESAGDILKRTAIGIGLGGVADAGIGLAGKALRKGAKSTTTKKVANELVKDLEKPKGIAGKERLQLEAPKDVMIGTEKFPTKVTVRPDISTSYRGKYTAKTPFKKQLIDRYTNELDTRQTYWKGVYGGRDGILTNSQLQTIENSGYGLNEILDKLDNASKLSEKEARDIMLSEMRVRSASGFGNVDNVNLASRGRIIEYDAPSIVEVKKTGTITPASPDVRQPTLNTKTNVERPFAVTPAEAERAGAKTELRKPTIEPEVATATKQEVKPSELDNIMAMKPDKKEQALRNYLAKLEAEKRKGIRIDLQMFGKVKEELKNLVSQRISRNAPKKKTKFGELIEKARTQLIDEFRPAEKVERGIRGGELASAEDSLYKQARLFKGVSEKANRIIKTNLEPIIKSAEKKGYGYDELGDYAVAVHARDLEEKGIKTGFTSDELDETIKKYKGSLEAERKQLIQYSNDLLDDLVESGRLSQLEIDVMKKKHPNYVPFFRAFDDDKVEFGQFLKESFSNVENPIKKIKGSERNIVDPMESLIKNTFNITNKAQRNRVSKQLDTLSSMDADGKFIRKMGEGEEVSRKNVVSAYIDGKKVSYEVEPELFKMMNNMGKEPTSLVIKIASMPATVLRAGATLAPEFFVRNPIKDVMNAYVTSESGFNPLTDFTKGLFHYITKNGINKFGLKMQPSKLYDDFIKSGGGLGDITSMDRDAHREALERAIKQPVSKKFVSIVNGKALIQLLRTITEMTEQATKIGEFGKALKKGASKQEAAYRARDLMDFARAGTSMKNANKMIAFLNSTVQGKSKIVRAIHRNPKGTLLRMANATLLPALAFYGLNRGFASEEQKKTIADAPDWMKNNFWLIAVPGTDLVARIPKPFDISVISNFVERGLSYIDNTNKNAMDDFVTSNLADQIPSIIPTAILPMWEAWMNKSFFRQAPIVPQREQGLQYKDQFDVNTSEIAKLLSKGFRQFGGESGDGWSNLGSPRIMDNLIKGYTAGLGGSFTDIMDYIVMGVNPNATKRPAKDLTQFPVTKAFFANSMGQGKSISKLYDLKSKLDKEKASKKLSGEKFSDVDYNKIKSATEKITDMNKDMREITNSKTLTPEQKKTKLLALNKKRNDLAIKARKSLQKR